MPVVRSQIDSCFDAILFAGIYKFTYNVSLSVFPGGVLHTIVRIFTGPKAEAVGMFGSDDGTGNARRPEGTHPLSAIESRRVEDSCRSTSVTFVYILLKCVDSEMEESDHLTVVPLHLACAGG